MSARVTGLVLLAAAAGLYFLGAARLERQAAAAADEYGRARVERQEALARAAALERRNQARGRAYAAVRGAAADPAAASRAVRRSVAQVVERSRAAGARLSIRPIAGGVDVSVSARGPVDDVLRLTGDLVRPEVGVVLERVQIQRGQGDVTLQVEGAGVAGTP